MTIKLKKGFEINLSGKAARVTREIEQPVTFGLRPTDFNHITMAKPLVKEGESVRAGDPIFYEKTMEEVLYCAPVSGEIIEIKRGSKRRLEEIKILSDKVIEFKESRAHSSSDLTNLSREGAQKLMVEGGVWPHIIQRPYGCVATPTDIPRSIFISAFDTHPLSPDYAYTLQGQRQYFQAGINVLRKFTSGKIHLNTLIDADIANIFSQVEHVEYNKVSGKHPAGNVGVQIHHISPINKGDIVWTLSPIGVVEIGKFLLHGIYDTSKLVAVTGSEVKEPSYVRTYTGAHLGNLLKGNVSEGANRYISGNVLTGESVGVDGYLGYYHRQISVIPEGNYEELFGWIKPSWKKLSFHRAFGLLSYTRGKKKEFSPDTNQHGEPRNFVMTGVFEKVLPMDILPTYLFKAILAGDYDDMESLGIYELIEEDVALCEYIDVSKHSLQAILRAGIELIKHG